MNGHFNTGLFHESQHNSPQSQFFLIAMTSKQHSNRISGNDTYPHPMARNYANFFGLDHQLLGLRPTRREAAEYFWAICPTLYSLSSLS
jgi:hypothetical protein